MDESAKPADPDRKPPRFPWVQALFCAACLGAAAWTWMRYSYCWDVTAKGIWEVRSFLLAVPRGTHDGSYVRFRGKRSKFEASGHGSGTILYSVVDGAAWVDIAVWNEDDVPAAGKEVVVTGRMIPFCHYYPIPFENSGVVAVVETTYSRFTGASIAGLVVGAMGVFVFALYLRTWVKERKAFFTTEARRKAFGTTDEHR